MKNNQLTLSPHQKCHRDKTRSKLLRYRSRGLPSSRCSPSKQNAPFCRGDGAAAPWPGRQCGLRGWERSRRSGRVPKRCGALRMPTGTALAAGAERVLSGRCTAGRSSPALGWASATQRAEEDGAQSPTLALQSENLCAEKAHSSGERSSCLVHLNGSYMIFLSLLFFSNNMLVKQHGGSSIQQGHG